jgi:sugar phosphate isomerase/epimerase
MPEYAPEDSLALLADAGYNGAELRVIDDSGDRSTPSFWNGNRASISARELIDNADTWTTLLNELNLSVPSLGTYIDAYDERIVREHMEACRVVGAKNLRISPGSYAKGDDYMAKFNAARERYAFISKLADEYGCRAVIETHPGLLSPSVFKARQILDGLDPKTVGIMWDPANQINEGRETYAMAIDIAGDYLAEVHVKNVAWSSSPNEQGDLTWRSGMGTIRDGVIDWADVVQELKDVGYDGWFFYEDFSTEASTEEKIRSFRPWFQELLDS